MTIGSCLLANELEGMGKEMLEMRIKGESWASIAHKFDLPNPSAARSKFTKLTGITDYKAKGQVLQSLANDLSSKASKTGIFETKVAQKKVKKALDLDAELNDLTTWQKATLKQYENEFGKDHPVYKQKAQEFKNINAIKPAPKPVVEAVTKDLPEGKPAKWKSNQQIADDNGLTPSQVGDIIAKNEQGKGYLAIKNETGVDFKQIDDVVWNSLLKKADGDVWKAYKAKPTSQSGYEAVKDTVLAKKKMGLSNKDIADLHDMPESVVDAIGKGSWNLPGAGSVTPHIPPPPPQPAAVFGTKVESGFEYRSNQKMMNWIRDDSAALPPGQRGAISNYTGSGSSSINTYLRNGAVNDTYASSESMRRTVEAIDKTMRPMPFSTKVTRHVDIQAFGKTDLSGLAGTVFRDKGFLSTFISETGVFTSHNVKMVIDVPAGAKARYVQDISVHKSEQELLLARNTPIKINSVERLPAGTYGGQKWIVHGEVVV